MKVLLIYPEFPEAFWSMQHAIRFEGKRAAVPPLGLLTVAALLPRAWERRLVDMNVQALRQADIQWADLIMISAMLVQKDSLLRVIELCKEEGKRVAVGGPYLSASLDSIPEADYLFIGEAEATLPEFVRELAEGKPEHIYQAAERPALSLTPVPEFELADLRQYDSMTVQYSRGCPFQCEFCDIIEIYGRAPRTKSNAQLLAELEALYQRGWRGMVFIVDDNFIGNKPHVKRLLPALAEWNAQHGDPFSFMTEASLNLAEDEELLAGMRRANFRHVFLGIETPVAASLKETHKLQNTRHDLVAAVRRIQSYGMEVMAGFIVGFDSDPDDVFAQQIAFIRASAIPVAMVGILCAIPNTQLWRRLEREGRLLTDECGRYVETLQNFGSAYPVNFVPKMAHSQLVAGYQTILRTIYDPTEFYQRALACLTYVKQDKPEPMRLSLFAQALMLARALFVLGIWGRARGPFWRYFWTVLRRHRRKFGWALRLAAMGYHFRVLTDKHFGGAAARVEQPARSGQRLALGAPVAGAGKIMTKVELKETVLQR